jgi:hypothetical protein
MSQLDRVSVILKPIFKRWEKLHIGYNLILAVTLLLTHGVSMGRDFIYLAPLWLAGAVAANIRGLVLSITCEYFFPMIGILRFNE